MFDKALEIYTSLPFSDGYGFVYSQYGNMLMNKKDYAAAEKMCLKGYAISDTSEDLMEMIYACECLYDTYEGMGNYEKALHYHIQLTTLKDSLKDVDNIQEISRKDEAFRFEQLMYADSLKRIEENKVMELERAQDERQQRNVVMGGMIGGVFLLLIIGLLLRGNRMKQRNNRLLEAKNHQIELQKKEVEHQKLIIEERNKETMDSIVYARRLQDAILPSTRLLQEFFAEHFVLYQPKDIVSGDFYWLERKHGYVYVAVADCTGHGVPGALVSVVCHNALNRALFEFMLSSPADILDKVRELVIESFGSQEGRVSDGMDISLLALKEDRSTLVWSGANNPLWVQKPGEKAIMEIRPDKQPVGRYTHATPFRSHSIDLVAGTRVFLFSDGFADQFGGQKGKKFKSNNLRILLENSDDQSLDMIQRALQEAFNQWKGDMEQVDDVCIIGVRVWPYNEKR
jgi:serine phosphatase RsbU (regulator of sigma subunit)